MVPSNAEALLMSACWRRCVCRDWPLVAKPGRAFMTALFGGRRLNGSSDLRTHRLVTRPVLASDRRLWLRLSLQMRDYACCALGRPACAGLRRRARQAVTGRSTSSTAQRRDPLIALPMADIL